MKRRKKSSGKGALILGIVLFALIGVLFGSVRQPEKKPTEVKLLKVGGPAVRVMRPSKSLPVLPVQNKILDRRALKRVSRLLRNSEFCFGLSERIVPAKMELEIRWPEESGAKRLEAKNVIVRPKLEAPVSECLQKKIVDGLSVRPPGGRLKLQFSI